MNFFSSLPPQIQGAIITFILAAVPAIIKAFFSSKKATFFQRAHEAAVVGIEHSECQDCRDSVQIVSEFYGVEHLVNPVVKKIKAVMKENSGEDEAFIGFGPSAPTD